MHIIITLHLCPFVYRPVRPPLTVRKDDDSVKLLIDANHLVCTLTSTGCMCMHLETLPGPAAWLHEDPNYDSLDNEKDTVMRSPMLLVRSCASGVTNTATVSLRRPTDN